MDYKTNKIEEEKDERIYLDNAEISADQFNKTLENLTRGQRIIETSHHNFHLIERIHG